MALTMDRLERMFSSSRRKEKALAESLSVVTPQHPSPGESLVFPSPSFIRPKAATMKPREEERQLRSPDGRERTLSFSSQGRSHSRQLSNSSSINRGRPRHIDSTGQVSGSRSENIRSLSPFKFPEDSIFRHDPNHRYSIQNRPKSGPMEQVNEEPANLVDSADSASIDSSPRKQAGDGPTSTELFRPVVYEARPENPCPQTNTTCAASHLSSPIIMPSPISPALAASALSMLESLPPSPTGITIPEKDFSLPILPRLNRFSTLNLPHLESPSASDSEDEPLDYGQYPSPASLSTPNTFSTRESFDSLAHSLVSSFSSKKAHRETWCSRENDPCAATATWSSVVEQAASPRNSFGSWSCGRSSSVDSANGSFFEPTVSDFLALTDDEVAEEHNLVSAKVLQGPTPPPKNASRYSGRSSTCSRRSGIQKSASNCTVRAEHNRPRPQSFTTAAAWTRTSLSATKPAPIRASTLISTIATTFGFDEIYIMSFWPDDRKRRGRLLDFPMHFENARSSKHSRRESKPRVAGRLLASYGIEGATGTWELPTDILAEALDTEETWYEYQDVTPPPDGLSHGFMCSFYGNRLPSAQSALDELVNRGIVFAAFHTQSKPIITSGTLSDRNLLLGDLRLLAKVLVDETIKNL